MLADVTHEYFEEINKSISGPEDLVLFLFLVGIALGNTLNENLKRETSDAQARELLEVVIGSAVITFNEKNS